MAPMYSAAPHVKKAMKLNIVEGAFAVAAENLAAPYLALFALSLGATFLATILLRLSFPLSFQLIFTVAAALGLAATFIFSRIDFDQGSVPTPGQGQSFRSKVRDFWREVRSELDFRHYLLSSLIWNFGVTLAGSLFVVHFVDNLGGRAGAWAVFSGVNLAAQVLVQRYWGKLADRFGQKNVMLFSGLGAVLIPLLWWGTDNTWFPVIIFLINGLAWGGYNLAAFNLLLEITPDSNRTVFLGSAVLRALGLYVFYRTVSDAGGQKMGFRDLLPRRSIGW